MITSFFNTSKPIHFVIAGVFMFVLLAFNSISELESSFTSIQILIGIFAALFLSVLVFAFFVNKNDLTQKNGFKVLFFCLFFALLPSALKTNNLIISNFFVLLALRRLFSLRSNLRIKKKLFDAAFWIAIASLFYFWSILFFFVVIMSLVLFSIGQIKNWIIPFASLLVVIITLVSYNIIVYDTYGSFIDYYVNFGFDFTKYNSINLILPITIFFALGLWALIFFIKSLKEKTRVYRPSFLLVIAALMIAMAIVVLSPEKDGSEFIFSFAPMAIIMSNYIESIKDRWFAELYVWLITLTPIALLVLHFSAKS